MRMTSFEGRGENRHFRVYRIDSSFPEPNTFEHIGGTSEIIHPTHFRIEMHGRCLISTVEAIHSRRMFGVNFDVIERAHSVFIANGNSMHAFRLNSCRILCLSFSLCLTHSPKTAPQVNGISFEISEMTNYHELVHSAWYVKTDDTHTHTTYAANDID